MFGLLDFLVVLLFILPAIADRTEEYIYIVNLISLKNISWYTKVSHIVILSMIVLFGVLQLALQNIQSKKWNKAQNYISLILSVIGILWFILSLQPDPAMFLIMLIAVKIIMLIKVSRM